MTRPNEFPKSVKMEAWTKQGGVCAFYGTRVRPPAPAQGAPGARRGDAHHLRPASRGGPPTIDNCVYLCWAHHLLLGHGMAPYGIDRQGGDSHTWAHLRRIDFPHWRNPLSVFRQSTAPTKLPHPPTRTDT